MVHYRPNRERCCVEEVLLVLPNGDVLQRPHFCQNWGCEKTLCRGYKAGWYIDDPRAMNYRWWGVIESKNWRAIRGQCDRLDSKHLLVTFQDSSDRLIVSDKDVGGRNHLLVQLPLDVILPKLRQELMVRHIKRVTPQPTRQNQGIGFINKGNALRQTRALINLGFKTTDNPSFWKRPEGWNKESTIEKLKDELGTVRMIAA
jgi:hypothetical protein